MDPLLENILGLFRKTDPDIEHRISSGIETNRKGYGTIRLVDHEGKAVRGAKIHVKQMRHEFLFGANAFMLDGYDSKSKNQDYERHFSKLFNSAVVPYFWRDLEPEPSKPRFTVDSSKVFRRPPPDRVLDFCKSYKLTPKGHCLIWHDLYPQWLPQDAASVTEALRKRFEEIALRYGDQINYWDVVNEPFGRSSFVYPQVVMPDDYVFWSFKQAEELFPSKANLILNETIWFSFGYFNYENTPLYLLAKDIMRRGGKLDRLGFQYHLFDSLEQLSRERRVYLNPVRMFQFLDRMGSLGLPLHISEITLPAYSGVDGSEDFQMELMRYVYRLWFSHPMMEAIYWWNVNDGAAYGEEEKYHGGVLDTNLKPKAIYHAMDDLLNKEWNTSFNAIVDSEYVFHGFYGEYDVTVEYNGRQTAHHISLSKSGGNEFNLAVTGSKPRAAHFAEVMSAA